MSFLNEKDLKRKGEEFLKKINKQHEFFSKALEGEDAGLKPVKKGEIPKLAVLLGLLDPFFFDLYQMCDGKRDLNVLSEALDLDVDSVKILIDKLIKNGLIKE